MNTQNPIPRRFGSSYPAAAFAIITLFCAGSALANTQVWVTGTNLSVAGSYSNSTTSQSTDDVTLTSGSFSGTTLDVEAGIAYGTLNDVDGTALTITDNTTGGTLTLDGGSNSVSGANPSDLLYVASGAALTLQSGSKTLTLSLNPTGGIGNIDNAGTLSLAGPINITAGDTITFTGTGTTTVGGAIASTTAALVVNNSSTVNFTAGNSYSGGLTIQSGTATGNNTSSFGSSTITLGASGSANATLIAGKAGALSIGNAITVAGGNTGILVIGGTTSAAATTWSGAITLNSNVVLQNTVSGFTSIFNNTITGSSTISIGQVGAGGVGGGVVLTGANGSSFTGNIILNATTLNFASGSLGNGSGTITFAGGTLQYAATSNTQDVSSRLQSTGASTVRIDVNGEHVVFGSALTSANLAGTGGFAVSSSAAGGTLTLTGVNTFTGGTAVTSGTLILGNELAVQNSIVTISAGTGTTGANNGVQFTAALGDAFTFGGLSGASNEALLDTTGNAVALTIGNNNDTGMTYSGILSGAGSLIMSGTGVQTLSGANTFTGGLTIANGTVVAGVSNVGTASGAAGPSTVAITLGATGGSNPASLLANTFTVSNAINLGTTTGLLTIGNNGLATAATFSGAIGLNGNNLTIAPAGTGSVAITGGITGTGNLTISDGSTSATTTISATAVNNIGTITNNGAGTGTATISAGVGPNVTGITESSAGSALTVSGSLTVNSAGTTLTNSNPSGSALLTFSGGIGGTGNLLIDNNSSVASGITISTLNVNNIGTLTNAGAGTGSTAISAVIGTNVTSVTENSTTSGLALSGANTFTGGLTILSGTVTGSTSTTNAFGAPTSVITLGNGAGGSSNATLVTAVTGTFANPITLASTTTGALTIASSGNVNPVFSGNVTGNNNLVIDNSANTGNSTLNFSGTVNNVGSITQITGVTSHSPNTVFSGVVGSNVTALTEDSSDTAGSSLTVSGALNVNSTATTLTNMNPSGGTGTLVVSGSVVGTGNLILDNDTALAGGVSLTTGGVNNTGTVTNSGTGTGAVTISGGIGTNVTGVIENSASSALTISAAGLTVNSATTTLTNSNSSGSALLTVSGSMAGGSTSTLVLDNNSAINGGITLSGTITTTGTIANMGTGAGWSVISGANTANANPTLVENSATSPLALTNNQTALKGVTVLNGELLLGFGPTLTTAATFGGGAITLGASGSSVNAGIFANEAGGGSVTVGNNITVTPGYLGTATLGSITPGAVTYSGAVNFIGVGNLTLAPYGAGALKISNPLVGGTNLIVSSQSGYVSSSGQTYGMNYATAVLSGSGSTYSGQTQILSGNLELSATGPFGVAVDSWLGTSGTSAVPVLVGATSGVNQAGLLVGIGGLNPAAEFNRAIVVQAGNAGNTYLASSDFAVTVGGAASVAVNGGGFALINSTVSLDKSVYIGGGANFSGVISPSPTAPGGVAVNLDGVALNANNTYNGGTVNVRDSTVVLAAGGLGTGNVSVENGELTLSASNDLASGRTIYVGPDGALGIQAGSGLTQAYLASIIDPTSSGAIDYVAGQGAGFATALNLATIGDGDMYLGTILGQNGGNGAAQYITYTAATLGADLDGNYRLGWNYGVGTNTAVFSSANVITGTGALIVGGTAGNINPTSGIGIVVSTNGEVYLAAANNYSGGTVVNSYSLLTGSAQTSGSPFGSATAGVTLHNAALQLLNSGASTTTTTLGALSFDGNSVIRVTGTTGGSNTLALGQITRLNNGTLILAPTAISLTGIPAVSGVGTLGSTSLVTTSGTLPVAESVDTNGSGSANVNMLAPWITDTAGDYLQLSGNSITPITTSVSNISGSRSNSYVKTTTIGATTFTGLSGTNEIAALSVGGSGLTNTGASPITLQIDTGGLTFASGTTTIAFGGAGNAAINLLFPTAEAVINTGANVVTIANQITADDGLTKVGAATLYLAATNNAIAGTITINQGTVNALGVQMGTDWAGGKLFNDSSLGTANILLNGGQISYGAVTDGATNNYGYVLSASRTISVGPDGGTILGSSGNATSGQQTAEAIVVNSLLSGTGAYLDLATLTGAGVLGGPGLIILTNTGNNLSAAINVFGNNNLVISDPRELGGANASTNVLSLYNGNAILQYGQSTGTALATPTTSGTISNPMVLVDGGGGVDVVQTSGTSVTLTLSGSVSGDGAFFKNGNGTLVLTATSGNTLSGSVIVNAGDLVIDNGSQLGLSTAVVTGTDLGASSVSGNAAYVEPGAELDLVATNGNFALGGSGGKTLYLSGTGAGNGGAIVNVSGSNSDAGKVILQGNTTIATAASSRLTFAGSITDGTNGTGTLGYGLTATGGGTLVLAGSSGYTGATVVNGGTLVVSGSISGSSGVSVTNATLAGTGVINSPVTIGNGNGATASAAITVGLSGTTGTLSTGALTLNSDAAYVFNLNPTLGTSDLLNVTGSIALGNGVATLTGNVLSDEVLSAGQVVFDIANSTTGITGFFAGLPEGSTFGAGDNAYYINYGTVVANEITLTAVPEPGTWAMLAAGFGVLIFRRRSRRLL